MSIIIPPGFAQAAFVLIGSTGTQPFVTTIGLDISEAGGEFVGAANTAFDIYATELLGITDDALTLSHVTLQIGQDGGSGSVQSDLPPANGTSSGGFGPVAMSLIARKNTPVLGRRGRGRMFIPGVLQEAGVEPDGQLTPTFRGQLQGHLNDFWTGFEDSGIAGTPISPVLLHSDAEASPTPITSFTASPLVGWIRGRIR